MSGTVTYEYDPSKPHGQVLSQSELPGTMLEPQSAVDYVVNDSAQASTEAAVAKTGEEEKYYVGSIDATCSLSNYIGPASQTSRCVHLYPFKTKGSQGCQYLCIHKPDQSQTGSRLSGYSCCILAVSRAHTGVDSGIVEVVDVDNDDKVIQSWPVSFFPGRIKKNRKQYDRER